MSSFKPEKFGKYILLEKLAQGGMAEIFLARAPGAGGISKFVAIKRILPQYSDNQDFIRMFKDEAKIVVNLSHSNIVSVNEFGVVKSLFFLVMDFVPGRNMRQILNKMAKKDTHFSVEQIVYIVNEVAAGLDHAHRCLDEVTGKPLNITHRDMSPQNVMVSFEGEIKVVDFGIAKAESQIESTRAGTLKGKFGYMSPEQAEGQTVDLRTDIFSLGIVLWEMLANERLFIANNEINTLRKIRDCQVPSLKKFNPNIHPELERIVMKSLARDRNMRYQTAAAMHRDLNRFLNRHYPDFSPQDFAVTVKTLFADEILQSRKRMQEYAKLPVTNAYEDDQTLRKEMVGNSAAGSYGQNDIEDSNPSGELHPQIKIDLNQKAGSPLDFSKLGDKLDRGDGIQDHMVKNHTLNNDDEDSDQPTQIRQNVNVDLNFETAEDQAKSLAANMSSSETNPNPFNKPASSKIVNIQNEEPAAFKPMFIGTFVMLAIAGALLFIESPKTPQGTAINTSLETSAPVIVKCTPGIDKDCKAPEKTAVTNSDPDQLDCENPMGHEETLLCKEALDKRNLEMTTIMVQSRPSGAKIVLNGIDTTLITPSSVKVPRHIPFDIELRKKGFIEYEEVALKFDDLESKKLTGVLQEAQVGFVNIDVIPPQNVRVYVNGKLIDSVRLPIKKYHVPANQSIKIEAVNPIKGIKTHQFVRLKNKQTEFVSLKLSSKSRKTKRRGN